MIGSGGGHGKGLACEGNGRGFHLRLVECDWRGRGRSGRNLKMKRSGGRKEGQIGGKEVVIQTEGDPPLTHIAHGNDPNTLVDWR